MKREREELDEEAAAGPEAARAAFVQERTPSPPPLPVTGARSKRVARQPTSLSFPPLLPASARAAPPAHKRGAAAAAALPPPPAGRTVLLARLSEGQRRKLLAQCATQLQLATRAGVVELAEGGVFYLRGAAFWRAAGEDHYMERGEVCGWT